MQLKIYSEKDFPGYLPKLNLLYDDLFSGGKGFRARLVAEVGKQISVPEKTCLLLAQTIEFIHNASLLHDDLIDRSILRRGKPAAWTKYKPEYAVLAGDYLLARVMVNLSAYGNINLVQYTAEMISDLLEGEWLQDSIVGDFQVDVGQLDRVHNLKTGSLFKWCLKAPFVAAGKTETGKMEALEEMGTILGLLFQRSDDLLDFDIRNDEGKALLGDLKSGYLNSFAAFSTPHLPVDERSRLKDCASLGDFQQRLGGEKVFKEAVDAFDKQNQVLIDLYRHRAENLKSLLIESEKALIPFLVGLPDILYWREKRS
jgi:octaprenyl-diphosphate synthase